MVARKRERLLVREVLDEMLVFNEDTSEANALNRPAAVVFELCDGETNIATMRTALDRAGLGPATDEAVWLALRDLDEAGLIDLDDEPPANTTRRHLLKMLGVGAAATAVVLPVVETILAPPAAAAGSFTVHPTRSPSAPTRSPSAPTRSPSAPTRRPTRSPSAPTRRPTLSPSAPTVKPTVKSPTLSPSAFPTPSP